MRRIRVAAFTPGPPQRSGGAVYAGALLPALAARFDVAAVSPLAIEWGGPVVAPEEFEPDQADVVLNFLGNNPEHLFAYRSAVERGGVAVCHDLMSPHLLGGFAPEEEYLDVAASFGRHAAEALRARRARGVATGDEAFFLQVSGRALRRAEAVVVHSRFAKFAVEADIPGALVHQVPSHTGAVPAGVPPRDEARARLGLPPNAFIVGMFGYLGGHKRVPQALAGIAGARAGLPASDGPAALRLVVVGAEVGMDVKAAISRLGLDDVATVVGSVDDAAFFEHLAAVDVVVNLRYPSLGETSAVNVQAMALGKAVITTDHGQFGEERAAIRVPPDDGEVRAIAAALGALATSPERLAQASALAAARAAECSVEAAADAYAGVVESVLRRRAADRPARSTFFAESAPAGKRDETRDSRRATPSPIGPTSSSSSA
jgi:glycosyltransferase involved in cell wall biosynthesis